MEIKPSKSIDTTGLACPYPSFEAVKALNSIHPNEILQVVTADRRSAVESIPNVCNARRLEFVVIEDPNGRWRVRIKKSD